MASSFYTGFLEGNSYRLQKIAEQSNKAGEELIQMVDEARAERDEAQNNFAEERRERNAFRAEVAGYQNQADYLMGLLDKAYGVENNPARKSGNIEEGENFTVPCGPREGQEITMADRMFMSGIHQFISERPKSYYGAYGTMMGLIKKIGLMK